MLWAQGARARHGTLSAHAAQPHAQQESKEAITKVLKVFMFLEYLET